MKKKAFSVLAASMFISMLGMGIISPFLPIYANTLGASKLEVGIIQAGFGITGIGTLLFIGRLSDRFGRKNFLSSGLIILAISSLGLMNARSPLHLILWRIVQGLGASSHMPIAQAYLGDITPKGDEGKWMGYFNAFIFAGMGGGPLLGGLISDAFGIRTTFLFMMILNALSAIATILFLKEMPRRIADREHTSFLAPLRNRTLCGVFSYNIANGVIIAGLMAFVPLFASLKLSLSSSLIGILLAARSPVSVLQSYTGRLADRVDRRAMVIFGGSISIIAIALLPATSGFWLLLIAYIAATFGQACGVPAANAYVVQEGRIYGMGTSVTLFMLALHIGTGIGPIALGAIADRFGLASAFYATSASMAVGILLFSLLVRRIPVTRY
jgi:MFS transporter, DHA1 family, multidrug resistance protein